MTTQNPLLRWTINEAKRRVELRGPNSELLAYWLSPGGSADDVVPGTRQIEPPADLAPQLTQYFNGDRSQSGQLAATFATHNQALNTPPGQSQPSGQTQGLLPEAQMLNVLTGTWEQIIGNAQTLDELGYAEGQLRRAYQQTGLDFPEAMLSGGVGGADFGASAPAGVSELAATDPAYAAAFARAADAPVKADLARRKSVLTRLKDDLTERVGRINQFGKYQGAGQNVEDAQQAYDIGVQRQQREGKQASYVTVKDRYGNPTQVADNLVNAFLARENAAKEQEQALYAYDPRAATAAAQARVAAENPTVQNLLNFQASFPTAFDEEQRRRLPRFAAGGGFGERNPFSQSTGGFTEPPTSSVADQPGLNQRVESANTGAALQQQEAALEGERQRALAEIAQQRQAAAVEHQQKVAAISAGRTRAQTEYQTQAQRLQQSAALRMAALERRWAGLVGENPFVSQRATLQAPRVPAPLATQRGAA